MAAVRLKPTTIRILRVLIVDHDLRTLEQQAGNTGHFMHPDRLAEHAKVSIASLYLSLERLKRSGWVTTHQDIYRGRRTVFYSLTPEGRQHARTAIHTADTYRPWRKRWLGR